MVFPVWAIFVLSESIFSLELEQLAKTYEHLGPIKPVILTQPALFLSSSPRILSCSPFKDNIFKLEYIVLQSSVDTHILEACGVSYLEARHR